MFNEHEIKSFLEDADIFEAVARTRKDFIKNEAQFLEISEHDFLSLIMMTPSVGIALSNGSVSLFEELALNRMARKMSKGGYFLKLDPVAHAMKYLIKNYDAWEMPFFSIIILCMEKSFYYSGMKAVEVDIDPEDPIKSFARQLMLMPYGFVRFLSSFFLHDENDVIQDREISSKEYNRIIDMSVKLKLDRIPAFQSFLKTFKVK